MKRTRTDDPQIVRYPDGTYYFMGVPAGSSKRVERSLKTDNFIKAIENKIKLLSELTHHGLNAHSRAHQLLTQYLELNRSRLDRGDIREKSFKTLEWCIIKYLIPFFGSYKLIHIDNDAFGEMRSKYGQINYQNHRKYLTAFLNWAKDKRLITHVPKFDVGRWDKRERIILTQDEILLVLQHSHGNLLLFVAMYLFMGMRSREITALKWEYINTQTMVIHLPGSAVKTGQAREFPINPFVMQLLTERVVQTKSLYVFPNQHNFDEAMSDGGFRKEWIKMLDRSGIIRPITPHDLRATYEFYTHINPNFTDTQREKMVGAKIDVQRKIYLSQFSAANLKGLESAVSFDQLTPLLEQKKSVGK